MFFSLPLDVQKHINEFDDDFRVMKLVIIRNILRDLHYKRGLRPQRACEERISNINNIIYKLCTHTYVNIWNDGDYHKPSYEYICKTCNADMTRYTCYGCYAWPRLPCNGHPTPHKKKRIYYNMN